MHALLLVSAVVPSLVLLGFFYFRDSFPEPPRVVLTTFLLGVVAVAPIWGYVQLHHYLFGELGFEPRLVGTYRAFVLAALPEELCKFAILMLYVRRHSAFDEPMDGLVYGAAASLGFATLENLIYVESGGWPTAIARAITAVPLHATLGVVMGNYIAEAHFRPERHVSLWLRGLCYALIFHGVYDAPLLLLSANPEQVSPFETQLLIAFVYLVLGMLIFQALWINLRLRALQRKLELNRVLPEDRDRAPHAAGGSTRPR